MNGHRLLTTDNVLRAYRVNVAPYLRPRNELVLGFRSLAEDLKRKRPRPRWKTNLVSHQQLRWYRSSLLGRIPGWSPPVPVVGPPPLGGQRPRWGGPTRPAGGRTPTAGSRSSTAPCSCKTTGAGTPFRA